MYIIVGISKKQTIQSTMLVGIIVCIVIVRAYACVYVCARNFDDSFQHMVDCLNAD